MEEKLTLVNRILETAVTTMNPQHVLEEGCRILTETLGISQVTVSYSGDQPLLYAYPGQVANATRGIACYKGCNKPLLSIPFNGYVNGIVEIQGGNDQDLNEQEQILAYAIIGALGKSLSVTQRYEQLEAHVHTLEATAAKRTFDLRNERDRTNSILEALGEAVIIVGNDGLVQYINPAAMSFTGYSSQEVWGKYWNFWFNDDNSQDLLQQIERTVKQGQVWDGEVPLRRKDGIFQQVGMTVMPYYDSKNENPIGFVAVQRDINPEKEIERLKEYFISNVSHELRTPLSVITLLSGNLDMLYNRMDDEKRKEIVKHIRNNTRVLNSLISDLLYLSRIDCKQLPTERQQFDLVEVVRKSIGELKQQAKEKEINLRITGYGELSVQGNREQIGRIVYNLIDNAIQNSLKNSTVTCEVARLPGKSESMVWPGSEHLSAGSWAAFQVVDTGSNIVQSDLPKVFDRFYRTVPSEQGKSPGLGLTIARELVRLNEGKIAVYSNPGIGSIISVYLPLM